MGLKRRVLVACDHSEIRSTLGGILDRWGLETTYASTIAEATAVLQSHSVDLIFCERVLANEDFHGLMPAVSAKKPAPRLILLLSDDKPYEALENGVFDAIPFPCRRSDLQWVTIQAVRDLEKPRRRPEVSPSSLGLTAQRAR